MLLLMEKRESSLQPNSRFEEQHERASPIENYIGNTHPFHASQANLAAGLGRFPFPTRMMSNHHPVVVVIHRLTGNPAAVVVIHRLTGDHETDNEKEGENGFVIATGFTTDITLHTLPIDGNIIDGITATITITGTRPTILRLKRPPQ